MTLLGSDTEDYLSSPTQAHSLLAQNSTQDPSAQFPLDITYIEPIYPSLDPNQPPRAILPPLSPSNIISPNPTSPNPNLIVASPPKTFNADPSPSPQIQENPPPNSHPAISLPSCLSQLAPLLDEHGLCIMAIPPFPRPPKKKLYSTTRRKPKLVRELQNLHSTVHYDKTASLAIMEGPPIDR